MREGLSLDLRCGNVSSPPAVANVGSGREVFSGSLFDTCCKLMRTFKRYDNHIQMALI